MQYVSNYKSYTSIFGGILLTNFEFLLVRNFIWVEIAAIRQVFL